MRSVTANLERDWLDFLDRASLRLPDKAQHRVDACGTAVADSHRSDAGAAIDIDGKHHDSADIAAGDAAITRCLEDAGCSVVRRPKERAARLAVVQKCDWLFGRRRQ